MPVDERFYERLGPISLGEAAAIVGGQFDGEPSLSDEIIGLSPPDSSDEGDAVFISDKSALGALEGRAFTLALLPPDLAAPSGGAALRAKDPKAAFALLAERLFAPRHWSGQIEGADAPLRDPNADIDENCRIAPNAFIGEGAAIGRGAQIGPGVMIGPGVQIGRDCVIEAGSSVTHALLGDRVRILPGAAVGQDGFGFVAGAFGPMRIPQLGRVILQDDVEVGAATTIDRGALGDTVIGAGSKIDNQVQIGHNVRVGRGCVIAAQCGVSGSVTIGDFAMIGGKVGLADHV
ncbi:MAG: UDP-3-O-(3-hydroxymyristoyl)glucosamine N-acyltransferase, partial [Pseudomonadota bacterium]